MRFKKEHYILILIFLLALSVRLFFAFQTPYFSSDESYLNLRLTEHITEEKIPLIQDKLSYSGRTLLYSPMFNYILAFFDLFLPIIFVAKIIPNIFASLLVIIIYLISKQLTNNKNIALFTSFISVFIPVYLTKTTNTLTVYSLMIPLIFYAMYCLMNINKLKYQYVFVIILAALLHPSSLLMVVGFLFYILIMKISNLKQDTAELEGILFATLITTWSIFLIFKNAFLTHGIYVIWQNIPSQILRYYFTNINIFDLIYKIGIIPLLCGIYIIFTYTYEKKSKNINLLIGLAISTFILVSLHLLELEIGLIFLGVILTILFSQFFKNLMVYISHTKISKLKPAVFITITLLFIISSVIPSLSYTSDSIKSIPPSNEIMAMLWLKENTSPSSIILTTYDKGHILTYFTKRKNVADSNFLLISNINERISDIKSIYTTSYETDAIQLLNKYNVDYIFLSSFEKSKFNIEQLSYSKDKKCFDLIYDQEIKIYKSLCTLIEK